jgi:hypothetical protein
MTIIGGTQRSGTSFLAKLMNEYGFNFGSDLWHEDIDGGFEWVEGCRHFQKILKDENFPFSDFNESVNVEKSIIDRQDIAKFSFILMNPKFVKIWYDWRGTQDNFLLTLRDPVKVCMSKEYNQARKIRFDTDADILKQSPEQLSCNIVLSLIEMKRYGFNFRIVTFPFERDIVLDEFRELGMILSRRLFHNAWSNIYEAKKIHYE